MQVPGTVTCSRCGKALPSIASFCDGCGARIAPIGASTGGPRPSPVASAAPSPHAGGAPGAFASAAAASAAAAAAAAAAAEAAAMPTVRPGFVLAGRGMPICHGCGAIAPLERATCGTCNAKLGTSIEAVPPRSDDTYWVQVRSELTCRQCGKRSPIDALDLGGTVSCGHCGTAQAFDVSVWGDVLAHAHAVGDLAAPLLRGRDPGLPGTNPFADVGMTRASATLETTGMRIDGGVVRTRNLALTATPGQPLCGACGCPIEAEVQGETVRTRCVSCGDRAEYRFPAGARQLARGLVAAIGDDLRVDRPDARLDATSAGMVIAVRCPSCGAGLDIPEGAHAARCSYCGTHCRIPSRTLLALRKSPGDAAPWWLLFRGRSAQRRELARGGSTVGLDREQAAPPPLRKRAITVVERERTAADGALAWLAQIALPLIVLALVGMTLFASTILSWSEGRTSDERPGIFGP